MRRMPISESGFLYLFFKALKIFIMAINKDNLEQAKSMHLASVLYMLGVFTVGGAIVSKILDKGGNMLATLVALLTLIIGIMPVFLVSVMKDSKPKEEKKEEKKS